MFVPDRRGTLHAYDAETGAELWNHSDGTGHQGGIISYAADGKQYVAVVAGFGGMAQTTSRRPSAASTRACRAMTACWSSTA